MRAMPLMPMAESLCMRTLWSRVSKAEDISRRTSMVPRLLLRPESRSEVMRVRTDSVDFWGWEALWNMLGMLLAVR